MKSLRPLTILIAGPLLLGAVSAVVGALFLPQERGLRDILFYFAAGAVLGLPLFGSIAAGLAFHTHLTGRLWPYVFRVQWYASLFMAFSLGYLIAAGRHQAFDSLAGLACLVVFLGALIKTAIGVACLSEN